MKNYEIVRIFVTVVLSACLAGSGHSQDIIELPESYRGIYASNRCDDFSAGGFWGLTSYQEVFVSEFSISVGPIFVVRANERWAEIRDASDPEYRYFISKDGESGALIYWAPSAELVGKVTPDDGKEAFSEEGVSVYVPCKQFPTNISAIFGESWLVANTLDSALSICRSNSKACHQALFDSFDVSENGQLTRSEMARAARYILQVAASKSRTSNNIETLAGKTAASFLTAPALAQLLLLNFDYDGSGALSLDEIAGHLLETSGSQSPTGGDLISAFDAIGDLAVEASKVVSTLPETLQ
ncbi:MAG: hypothetical protein ABJ251_12405 [Paracoccaceae bacterium]